MTQYFAEDKCGIALLCPQEYLPIELAATLLETIQAPTMEQIKATFAQCKSEKRAALVTYVTAGYPTAEETPDIMLGMEAGGAGTFPAFCTLDRPVQS